MCSAAGLKAWILVASYFFFSSRRRHTRYIGDWSSDVCSSDLAIEALFHDSGFPDGVFQTLLIETDQVPALLADSRIAAVTRSEERRVGKEWMARWLPSQTGKRNFLPEGMDDWETQALDPESLT